MNNTSIFQYTITSSYPVEEQSEVFGREAVEGPGREDVEEAQLQVLQRLLLTRDHPEVKRGRIRDQYWLPWILEITSRRIDKMPKPKFDSGRANFVL